jgi:hypothetical protein
MIFIACITSLFVINTLTMSCYAQLPIYRINEISNMSFLSDTVGYYQLIDVNSDSIADLVVGLQNRIKVLDIAHSTVLMDSLPRKSGSAGTMYSINPDSIYNYLITIKPWNMDSTMTFCVYKYPINNTSQIDSIEITTDASMFRQLGVIGILVKPNKAMFFQNESDSLNSIAAFFSTTLTYDYEGTRATYWSGFMIPLYINRAYRPPIFQLFECKGLSKCKYQGSQYLLSTGTTRNQGYSSRYPYNTWDITTSYLETMDYSLMVLDSVQNMWAAPSKFLNRSDNTFLRVAAINGHRIGIFNSPQVDTNTTHYMPGNAVVSAFNKDDSLHILTGCTNSYFEMRDLDMNLEAFIWGPNITISDAEPVDIDQDGTDELLCRTADGFVLYSLDTEIMGVFQDGQSLPNQISISSYPNPFNSEATIQISGAGETPVSIGIYDINGRQVRSLLAISGKAVWDARNDHGETLSSGVYFVRAAIGPLTAKTKLVLLK